MRKKNKAFDYVIRLSRLCGKLYTIFVLIEKKTTLLKYVDGLDPVRGDHWLITFNDYKSKCHSKGSDQKGISKLVYEKLNIELNSNNFNMQSQQTFEFIRKISFQIFVVDG